jgi:hypothetical protein
LEIKQSVSWWLYREKRKQIPTAYLDGILLAINIYLIEKPFRKIFEYNRISKRPMILRRLSPWTFWVYSYISLGTQPIFYNGA